MAKKFEEYKKEFATIKKAVTKANEEIDKNSRFVGQTSQVIKEGTKELGLRIQKIKDGGVTGKKIDDFKGDAEVKVLIKSIDDFMKGMEKELKNIEALKKNSFVKTVSQFWDFKKKLIDEIASRKKKKSGVIKIDSKSLPDMEKMLKEVNKYIDSGQFMCIDGFTPESIDTHRKQLDKWIQDEISQSKDVKLSKFQQEMDTQGLSHGNLNKNLKKAQSAYKSILIECKNAQDAIEARKNKNLMTAKVNVVQYLKTLDSVITPYDRAIKDPWIKSQIKESKEKANIEKSIKAMMTMFTSAKSEVKKIATVKL